MSCVNIFIEVHMLKRRKNKMFKDIANLTLGSAWNSMQRKAIETQLENLQVPDLVVSSNIREKFVNWLLWQETCNTLYQNLSEGVYENDREQLVSDVLAILAFYYGDKYIHDITIEGEKKVREQVLEELTSIVLNNWVHLNDSFKPDVFWFMLDGVYRFNVITQRTHMSFGPTNPEFSFRVLIILDCIKRLAELQQDEAYAARVLRTYSYNNNDKHSDEISYIRENLKEPRKSWQRDQYDWSKDKSCWIVTAYYGHHNHPNVYAIRTLRENLVRHSYIGGLVSYVNEVYQQIGRSRFGHWWSAEVRDNHTSIPHLTSSLICRLLLVVANHQNPNMSTTRLMVEKHEGLKANRGGHIRHH